MAIGHRSALQCDLIIFDCDGVLVDSEPILNRVFTDMLAEIGISMDYDEALRQFSGGTMATRLAFVEQRFRPLPAEFEADFSTRMLAAFRRELRPVPGIVAVLEAVPYPNCVASNGGHADIRDRLALAGLLARFEGRVFSAADVQRPKPFPDLFLHAARQMKAAPARCVVVEDSVFGVRAALAAGMTAFGYAHLSDPGALRHAGARVFADMDELRNLLS